MNILTQNQKLFLNKFFESSLKDDFFLTGGTALSGFYLEHRLSQDLDFFTVDQKVSFDNVNREILKIASNLNLKIKNQVASPTFLQYIFLTNAEDLKVDVVKDVPVFFGDIKKEGNMNIDSLINIAVGKLLAIFGRVDAKDFIDLFFILEIEKNFEFNELFAKAKQKDLGLNEFYLANSLLQIKNISIFPTVLKPIDKKTMTEYFLNLADMLFKKIKPEE